MKRRLSWFARAGLLDSADARDMAGWDQAAGFSLDAAVRIEGADRAGLERLLRYCARPPFGLQRLEQLPDGQIVYRFPKAQPDGRSELRLTPVELNDRLAALTPPPRRLDDPQQDVQHRTDRLGIASQEVAQALRDRQHPLTHRQPRENLVHQMCRHLAHAPCVARGAHRTGLAGKRDQKIVPALPAAGAGEAVGARMPHSR